MQEVEQKMQNRYSEGRADSWPNQIMQHNKKFIQFLSYFFTFYLTFFLSKDKENIFLYFFVLQIFFLLREIILRVLKCNLKSIFEIAKFLFRILCRKIQLSNLFFASHFSALSLLFQIKQMQKFIKIHQRSKNCFPNFNNLFSPKKSSPRMKIL